MSAAPRQSSFVVEVTQRCQHDCLHCYNVWKNEAPYPRGELGTAETLALLGRLLDQTGASLVTLSGGEPLLRPDLGEIVSFLADRGAAMNLVSNGGLINAKALDRIGRGRISIFELPLLGPEREVHDRLSGAEGAFDGVTAAITELKLAGERVVVVFVATRLNLGRFGETLELAIALGADGLMLNRFNPGGRGREHLALLQPSPTELVLALDLAERVSRDHELPISCAIPMPPCLVDTSRYQRLGFGFCAAGTERAYYTMDPLGNLRPCNHSPTILGNLAERSFAELAGSACLRAFVAARPRFCAGCSQEALCLGGCKAAAEVCSGSAGEMDPFLSAHRGEARRPSVTS